MSCQSASPPYSILLKYLDLVLFSEEAHESAMMDPQLADTVLKLYADFRPQQLPQLLLNSWLHSAFTPSKPLPLPLTIASPSIPPTPLLVSSCPFLPLLVSSSYSLFLASLLNFFTPFLPPFSVSVFMQVQHLR